MENYTGQTPSELLTLLMDGELQDPQATALFSSLSENEELRQEMQELLAIRESVRNDVEAFTPPADSKQAIFSELGFNAGSSTKPSPVVLPLSQTTSGFWLNARKFGLPVLATILASLFTAYFISDLYEDKISGIGTEVPVITSESNNTVPPANVPEIETNKSDNNNASNIVAIETDKKESKVEPISNNDLVADDATEENVIEEETEAAELFLVQPVAFSNFSAADFSSLEQAQGSKYFGWKNHVESNSLLPLLSKDSKSGRRGYTILLCGLIGDGANFNGNTNAFSNALGTGYSAGIFIHATEDLQVGAVMGNQGFNISELNEYYLDELSKGASFYDKPNDNFTWWGISARYKFNNYSLIDGLTPYGQATFGSISGLAPFAKLGVGLEYDLTKMFAFTMGIDGTTMKYDWHTKKGTANIFNATAALLIRF